MPPPALIAGNLVEPLKRLLKKSAEPMGASPILPGADDTDVFVRCTSATAVGGSATGNECFPAVIIRQDGDKDYATARMDLGVVWLTIPTGTGFAVPVSGAVYRGPISGIFNPGSDERPRVFAVVPASSLDYGYSELSGPVSVTTDAWTSTGCTVTLPGAGRYRMTGTAQVVANASALGSTNYIAARLYNSTGSAFLTAWYIVSPVVTGVDMYGTSTAVIDVTAFASMVVNLDVVRGSIGGSAWNSVTVQGTAGAAPTNLSYLKIA